jgi:hypothetical protein
MSTMMAIIPASGQGVKRPLQISTLAAGLAPFDNAARLRDNTRFTN